MAEDMHIDLRVAELLASRLCHDLVGPIGAVNNGMELIEDEDPDMVGDALKLAAQSARQAAAALQFYRLAYGMAGARVGGDLGTLRDIASRYLGSGKITLGWRVQVDSAVAPEGLGKLLLNMAALAAEGLPKGGALEVAVQPGSAGTQISVTAIGADAKLREDSEPALRPDVPVAELTPRNVQGYFTRVLARRLGADLTVDATQSGRLVFAVALPA